MDDTRLFRPRSRTRRSPSSISRGRSFRRWTKRSGNGRSKRRSSHQIGAILALPIVVTEQYPKGLGLTMDEVRSALGDAYRPVEKVSFSIMGEESIARDVRALGQT